MANDSRQHAIWTQACNRRTVSYVEQQFNRRPGRNDDEVLDIVDEPPHPTREFVQQWLAAQENKAGPSVHTVLIIVFSMVLIAFIILGVRSFRHTLAIIQPSHQHENTGR